MGATMRRAMVNMIDHGEEQLLKWLTNAYERDKAHYCVQTL